MASQWTWWLPFVPKCIESLSSRAKREVSFLRYLSRPFLLFLLPCAPPLNSSKYMIARMEPKLPQLPTSLNNHPHQHMHIASVSQCPSPHKSIFLLSSRQKILRLKKPHCIETIRSGKLSHQSSSFEKETYLIDGLYPSPSLLIHQYKEYSRTRAAPTVIRNHGALSGSVGSLLSPWSQQHNPLPYRCGLMVKRYG